MPGARRICTRAACNPRRTSPAHRPRRSAQRLQHVPASTHRRIWKWSRRRWWAHQVQPGDLRRVIAEHTGLLEREGAAWNRRFKAEATALVREPAVGHADARDGRGHRRPVIGAAVRRAWPSWCSARAGGPPRWQRHDHHLADGNSPHDLYFFEQTQEMLAGEVTPPGVFLRAAEVLRRQLFAFCLDDWVGRRGPGHRPAG